MLRHGRRLSDLGTAAFPWRELKLIVAHQNPSDSALYRSTLEHADYGYTDVLLTQVLNALRNISWQLAGDEDVPRPDPVLMPGQESLEESMFDRMSIEEMDARLAPYAPRK